MLAFGIILVQSINCIKLGKEVIWVGVTINDIAKIAGVNKSTVSRSLNDSHLVAEETKNRIKKIAEDLNFEFNASARSLNTKRTDTIGVIYPGEIEQFEEGVYHISLLSDIRSIFEKEGFDTIVTFPKNRFTGESNIKKLISRKKIDGLLIICSDIVQEDWDYIKKNNFPVVFLHYKPNIDILNQASFVSTDNFYGGRTAAEYLLSLGHKNILCFVDMVKNIEYVERLEGYMSYFRSAGISVDENLVIKGESSAEYGYKFIIENRKMLKDVTAVCVLCSDFMAMGVLKGLSELGYRVPEDISLIGYDDNPLGIYTIPALTTIHQPREEISSIATKQLIKFVRNKYEDEELEEFEPFKKLVKPTLVERKSCRRL